MAVRVCQICAVDFTLENFLLPLIDGMLSRGWSVTSVCSEGTRVAELRGRGYEISTIRIDRSLNPLRAAKAIYDLVNLFRKENFDVVHAHTPVAGLVARIAARIAKTPLIIYTAHGFYFHERMPIAKRIFYIFLERIGGLFTDILFSQSEEDAVEAARLKIINSNKIFVIGNGVDVNRFNPDAVGDGSVIRSQLRIPREAFVIGFIGRLVKEKGVQDFLEAAQMACQKHSHTWIVLIGDRLASDHSKGVEEAIDMAKKNIGKRLLAIGSRKDIPACISAMDLFCLPSWREGMPRTIIEAMVSGKPVLATNIRGSREEVVDGETGILVPVKSPRHLGNAMCAFIENPAWGLSLGHRGRERALNIYNEKVIVDLQLNLISAEGARRGILKS